MVDVSDEEFSRVTVEMDKEAEKILNIGYTTNSQRKYSYVWSQYEEWLKETNNNAMEQNTMINYLM
eukprot:5715889-Ditylum_brightwellii.AAC.1